MDGQEKILSLYAFVVIDDDGTEGVPAVEIEGVGALPMIGADLSMVKMFKPHARAWAKMNGKAVTLVHFSTRTAQETYEPSGAISHWVK